jgi:hypothetical protein
MIKNIELNPWLRKKIIIFSLILIIPVILLQIWSANRLATYGEKISNLEHSKSQLLLENEVLENQVAEKSSLNLISQKSQELGLGEPKKLLYVKPIDQVALNN